MLTNVNNDKVKGEKKFQSIEIDSLVPPAVNPLDNTSTLWDVAPHPELTSFFQSRVTRILNLACSDHLTKEFTETFEEIWDSSMTRDVFHDSVLKERFCVRSFHFLKEHLEMLAHMGVKSKDALSSYLHVFFEQLVRAFENLYFVLKISFEVTHPVLAYVPFILSGDVHKLLKYQLCFFWNYHLESIKEEFPEEGIFEGLPLFFGNPSGKQFLMRKKHNTFVHYTLFQGFKKSLPPLPLLKIREEFESLEADLSADPKEPSEDLEDSIERYMSQVCKGKRGRKPYLSYSLSASYSHSRKEGGQLGALLAAYRESLGDDYSLYQYTPVFRGWMIDSDRLTSIEEPGPTFEQVSEFWFQRFAFEHKFNKKSDAIPLGILEPLKVRIITKGDSLSLCGLHFVKDDLRSCLKAVPNGVFDLIFDSLDSSWDWNTVNFWESKSGGSEGWAPLSMADYHRQYAGFWCSGDYSAATNKCNGLISHQIIRSFCSKMGYDPEIAYRVERSLVNNQLHFDSSRCLPWSDFSFEKPEGVDVEERSYVQTNGQLMGSVISFPVLCLMNLFAYWQAREKEVGRELGLEELVCSFPLRINGDDILFPCSEEFYRLWSRVIEDFGFFKSQGKNLFLKDAFTINSVYYRLRGEQYVPQSFLNMGFLNGVKKGDGSNDTTLRATQMGRSFLEYADSPSFFISAAKGYEALDKLPRKRVSRARECFFRTYHRYFNHHRVRREWWHKNYKLVLRLQSLEKACSAFFPHAKSDEDPGHLDLRAAVDKIRDSLLTFRGKVNQKTGGKVSLPPSRFLLVMEGFWSGVSYTL